MRVQVVVAGIAEELHHQVVQVGQVIPPVSPPQGNEVVMIYKVVIQQVIQLEKPDSAGAVGTDEIVQVR